MKLQNVREAWAFHFLFCKDWKKNQPQTNPSPKKTKKGKNLKTKLKQIVGFWDLWFLLDCHIITVSWEEASFKKNNNAVSDFQTSAAIVLKFRVFFVRFCSLFLLKCNMYRFCSSSLYVFLCGTAAMFRGLHRTGEGCPAGSPNTDPPRKPSWHPWTRMCLLDRHPALHSLSSCVHVNHGFEQRV